MPRRARQLSTTGMYHAILKGINGQRIFEDDEDFQTMLDILAYLKRHKSFKLYAYCLMNNHIHLLIQEKEETLGKIFQRLGAAFVYWYNEKYQRTGHLFQNRYKSEPVESRRYFITVIRYIHQNPFKAGLIRNIDGYPWSSYHEYMDKPTLCHTSDVLRIFSADHNHPQKAFQSFHQIDNDDQCLEYNTSLRLSDREASQWLTSYANITTPQHVRLFSKKERNNIIKQCKNKGISIRQIERLTGVSFSIIRNI